MPIVYSIFCSHFFIIFLKNNTDFIPIFIHFLNSENVQNALKYYSNKDADMWPKNDIQATCDFMQNTSTFLKFMSESLITNFKTIEIIEETAKYFKNIAIPSGVLVKSTGQGLVQSCRAMALLLKILSNTMGISNLETTRLRKNESWLLEVEHSLLKDKIRYYKMFLLFKNILLRMANLNQNFVKIISFFQ